LRSALPAASRHQRQPHARRHAHPSKAYPGRKWLFWQYSGPGLSHGVNEKIDLNVFHGSEGEWQNWVQARACGGGPQPFLVLM